MIAVSGPFNDSAWRPVFAALSNADTREVYAQIVLQEAHPGSGLSPSRRSHALGSLLGSGLIEEREGRFFAVDDAFASILRAAPRPARRVGADRFLDREGRIDRYPSSAGDRRELLQHVVSQALAPGEILTESEVNERLSRFDEDVAALRRYLVDHDLLERVPNGTQYRRSDQARSTGA